MNWEDDDPPYEEGLEVDDTKHSGEGITVQINESAMERIEIAAMAGLRDALVNKADKIINDTIRDIVEMKLDAAIGSFTEQAVLAYLTKARPVTNSWGEKTGGTKTLADQIPDKVNHWLAERVEIRDGRRADYQNDKYPTRLDWIVAKFVRDELDVATKKAAADVTEKARQVVSAHVGRFVSEQMIPQIDVGRQ